MLYQPKYKCCVFKVTLGVTFTGEIVALVTLSLGIQHDGKVRARSERGGACTLLLHVYSGTYMTFGQHLREQIAHEEEGISFPYRFDWEWALGDGPYEVFPRCLVPHRPQRIPGSNPPR